MKVNTPLVVFLAGGGFCSADQAALATRLHGVVGVFGILGAGTVEQVGYWWFLMSRASPDTKEQARLQFSNKMQ